MEKETKKTIINVLYAIVAFYAIISAANLIFNAISFQVFKVSAYGDLYDYTGTRCLAASIIALLGLALFVASFFIKKGKKLNLTFIILEALVIVGLVVIMIISKGKLQTYPSYNNVEYVDLMDLQLYLSMVSLYIQQFITFALLLGIQVYQMIDKNLMQKID